MSVFRRCLPFALFTAPIEVFLKERLFPFLAGLCAVSLAGGLLLGLKARKRGS